MQLVAAPHPPGGGEEQRTDLHLATADVESDAGAPHRIDLEVDLQVAGREDERHDDTELGRPAAEGAGGLGWLGRPRRGRDDAQGLGNRALPELLQRWGVHAGPADPGSGVRAYWRARR